MIIFDQVLVNKIRQLSKDSSWGDFCAQILKHLGITKIKHNNFTAQKSPILLISNHNSVLDSLILGQLINRKDYYFVALATYSLLGPKIATQAIPIYRKLKLNHLIFEYPLSLISNRPLGWLSKHTVQAKNRASIARAAEKINQGGLVSIFPTGGAGKKIAGGNWKPGVGFLVKQITNPNTQIIFCQISGTHRADLLLFFHPLLRKIFYHRKILPMVCFSPPQKLSNTADLGLPAKQITLKLERAYQTFVNQA